MQTDGDGCGKPGRFQTMLFFLKPRGSAAWCMFKTIKSLTMSE